MPKFSYNEATGQFFSTPYTKAELKQLSQTEEEDDFFGPSLSSPEPMSEAQELAAKIKSGELSDQEAQQALHAFLSKITGITHPFKK